MEKITKNYVKYLLSGREWCDKEIEHSDPELIDVQDIACFKFYEKSFIKDGEDLYTGQEKNYSQTYYVGTRLTIEDALAISSGRSRDYLQRLYDSGKNVSFCQTKMGLMEMPDDAITLDEYIASKNTSKKK